MEEPTPLTFEFILDEDYVRQAFKRASQAGKQSSQSWLQIWMMSAIAAIAVFVYLISRKAPIETGSALIVGLLFISVFVAFSKDLNQRNAIENLRSSPCFQTKEMYELSELGVHFESEFACSEYAWAAFAAARRFDDGFALVHVSRLVHWLPMSALTIGSADDVARLLQKHLTDYKQIVG